VAVTDAPMHGGNVHAAARDLRRSVGSILDFSASINPLGPSAKALRSLRLETQLIGHYPDPDCVSLRGAIARRCRVDVERIVVGNGSTELIDLLPRALSFRSVLIVGPTYGEYASAVGRAGGEWTMIMADKDQEYRPPLEQLIDRLSRRRRRGPGMDSIFLCHPNSPTGRPSRREHLQALFAAAESARVWVVVDESFIEYCPTLTCVPQQHRYSRLIILRSFTKFYGLPGLRVGYSLSSRSVAAALRRLQPPWTVNAAAQQAAEAAMADASHAERCLITVQNERPWLAGGLSAIDGVSVIPSAANFLLLELPPSSRATMITAALRRQGILVRDCSSIEGCTERMIRVAVRRRQDNQRLLAALTRLLQK
jgi:threonine-phosphate decarboxylase